MLNNNEEKSQINSTVNELPLKIDTTPLTFNIVAKEQGPVLEATYKNDSQETIASGQTSNIFTGRAPTSGNIDDVEVLKYKISLSRGVYMEYDVKSKQYNWS